MNREDVDFEEFTITVRNTKNRVDRTVAVTEKCIVTIIDECASAVGYKNRKSAPRLPWRSDEWKLFHAFGNNVRKPVTPTLREIGVRYETYQKWVRDLERYCTIHAEFYPKGYLKYTHYHVLFTSDHEEVIQSVFSWLPVTPVFTEIGNQLLVSVPVPVTASDRIRALMCHLYDMKAKRTVERFAVHFQR